MVNYTIPKSIPNKNTLSFDSNILKVIKTKLIIGLTFQALAAVSLTDVDFNTYE